MGGQHTIKGLCVWAGHLMQIGFHFVLQLPHIFLFGPLSSTKAPPLPPVIAHNISDTIQSNLTFTRNVHTHPHTTYTDMDTPTHHTHTLRLSKNFLAFSKVPLILKDTMPLKPLHCLLASSCWGWEGRPGYMTSVTWGEACRNLATAKAFFWCSLILRWRVFRPRLAR